jgi:hypothetical protein
VIIRTATYRGRRSARGVGAAAYAVGLRGAASISRLSGGVRVVAERASALAHRLGAGVVLGPERVCNKPAGGGVSARRRLLEQLPPLTRVGLLE